MPEHKEIRTVWERVSPDEHQAILAMGEDYKTFLDASKTERRAVATIMAAAERRGFRPLGAGPLAPGDRVYAVNRGKAVILAVVGERPPEDGFNIVGAHIDAPRLDLKPRPLYEEEGLALAKTHYYGGIKKYQWLAIPLALHGVVILANGEKKELALGEAPEDPVFTVTDLLPHLAKDQLNKKMADAVPGESLNLLVGSIPAPGEERGRVKRAILEHLFRVYGITEEDFVSAELEAVPAWRAVDIGFDRSLVGGYGQDDRACAYALCRAITESERPLHTAIALFADKEEIGSRGNTGMGARYFEDFVAELLAGLVSGVNHLTLRRCLRNSRALSADVNTAIDPTYADVMEKHNAARIGCGVVLTKYTGTKGKQQANDTHAEYLHAVRSLFNRAGVVWQVGELGKVDQGGGGTIAYLLAAYGMDVIDCGPPLLSMHAPLEVASKADIYMTYRAYRAFLGAAW